MNTSERITEIDAEIERLMQVRKLLLTCASFQTSQAKAQVECGNQSTDQ